MTVTYSGQVANVRFGGFARLLFHWKGSIYKLVYRELFTFIVLYASISLTYRFLLNDPSKRTFEQVVLKFQAFTDLIPLTFVVGFYVSLVVTRWWNQYLCVPWPDPMMLRIGALVHGVDEKGRMYRRTLMRYLALCSTLLFCSISLPVKKRFPTLDHIVEAGIMTPREKKMYEDQLHSQHNKYWIPLMWFSTLAVQARKENRIDSDMNLHLILSGLEDFRGWAGGLFSYDWISTPLVYTQVVTLVTYTFFLATLMARQYLDPKGGPEGGPHVGHEIDLYVPIFTILQFIFYMGWVKVAEQLINPFGEDDDDFDSNWLIDRNLQVSYLAVDELYCNNPPLEQDIWWDETEPDIPYTNATVKQANRRTEFLGSTAQLSTFGEDDYERLESEDMQIVSPMETIPENENQEDEELMVHCVDSGISVDIKGKTEMSRLIRGDGNDSPTPTEQTNHSNAKPRKAGPSMVRPTANGDYESNLSIDKASLHGVRAARLQDNYTFSLPRPLQDENRNRSFISQISDWTAYLNPLDRDRQRVPSRSTSPNPSLTTQASSKRRYRTFGEPRRQRDRFDVRSVRTISTRGDSMTDVTSRRSDDEDDVSRITYPINKAPDDTDSLSPSVRDHYPHAHARFRMASRQDSIATTSPSTPLQELRRKHASDHAASPVADRAETPSTHRTFPPLQLAPAPVGLQSGGPQPSHLPPTGLAHHKSHLISPQPLRPGSTLHLGTPTVMPQPPGGAHLEGHSIRPSNLNTHTPSPTHVLPPYLSGEGSHFIPGGSRSRTDSGSLSSKDVFTPVFNKALHTALQTGAAPPPHTDHGALEGEHRPRLASTTSAGTPRHSVGARHSIGARSEVESVRGIAPTPVQSQTGASPPSAPVTHVQASHGPSVTFAEAIVSIDFPLEDTRTAAPSLNPSATANPFTPSPIHPFTPSPTHSLPFSPLVALPPSPTASTASISTSRTLTPPGLSEETNVDQITLQPVEADLKTSALDAGSSSKEPSPTEVESQLGPSVLWARDPQCVTPTTSTASLASTDDGSEYNTVTKNPATQARPGILSAGLFEPPTSLAEETEGGSRWEGMSPAATDAKDDAEFL